MTERFFTVEECDRKIMDADLDKSIFETLKENILAGEVVLFDDEKLTYRIVPRNMPILN